MKRPGWKARRAARVLRTMVPKIEGDLKRLRARLRDMQNLQHQTGGYALDIDKLLGKIERKEARLDEAITALRKYDEASVSGG